MEQNYLDFMKYMKQVVSSWIEVKLKLEQETNLWLWCEEHNKNVILSICIITDVLL